jgi:hypothetical protein
MQFAAKILNFFFSQTQMLGFGSGSAWIRIVFGSWIRIRIKVKVQELSKAQKWSHGGPRRLKNGVQWSQIRITLLRSRIRIRNEVKAGSGSATSRKTAEQLQTYGLLGQRCKATPRHRDTQTPSSLRPPTWTASGKICNFCNFF